MKPIAPIVLKTSRLLLRPPVKEDAATLECYLSDRRIAETTAAIPHPYPRGGALDWMTMVDGRWADGTAATFVVVRRDNGKILGVISLMGKSRSEMQAGYWIAVPFWGNGYATEALHRIVRYAFNHLGLPRLGARHFAHNPASGRVMLKAGLHFDTVIPAGSSRDGVFYDSVQYSITAEDWRMCIAI